VTERPDTPFHNLRARTLIPFTIFAVIGLYVVFRIVASLTPIDPEDPTTGEAAFQFVLYGALALWTWWACRRSGTGMRRLVGRVPAGYNWLPVLGLLVVAGLFSVGSLYATAYGLWRIAPGMLEWLLEAGTLLLVDSIASGVMWTLIAVVLVPVVEEVIFRGILVNRWGVKWGVTTGIVASSILFGVLHPMGPAGSTIFDLAAELQEIEAMALPGLGIAAVTLPVLVWYLRRHWPGRGVRIPYETQGVPTPPCRPREPARVP